MDVILIIFIWVPNGITISCPSIHGFHFMFDICNKFACDNSLTCNSKKTVCIKFGEVKLNDTILKWNTEVRHLAFFFNYKLDNSIDSDIK